MKKLLFLATAVSCLALAGMAHAQADAGDLGIFFTATPTTGADAVKNGVIAFAPAGDVYVVQFGLGVEAYEFSVTLPVGALVSGCRTMPQGCTDFGAGDDNWIVGTGGACLGEGAASQWLVKYGSLLFLSAVANDVTLCLGGASPSSFPNGRPGYLRCAAAGDLRNYGSAYEGCAIINRSTLPEPVADDASSFGALKAAY
jgi:hypothetical protein